jgi:hypothetical protein
MGAWPWQNQNPASFTLTNMAIAYLFFLGQGFNPLQRLKNAAP